MEVSIVTIVRNEARFMINYLDALSNQEFTDFEAIIIDNGSTDRTVSIINNHKDSRIRLYSVKDDIGLGALRNEGLQHCKGTYVFFTDGDCMPSRYWLTEGLRSFKNGDCLGVEGRTFYQYHAIITMSDYNTESLTSGRYMTCNMAYRRDTLVNLDGFDPNCFHNHEDRELALRVLKLGVIHYCNDMLVCHQNKTLTVGAVLKRSMRAESIVYIMKHHKKSFRWFERIIYPQHLLIIFFPFLLLTHYSYRSTHDIYIGLFKYLSLFLERFVIWRAAIRNRIFLI